MALHACHAELPLYSAVVSGTLIPAACAVLSVVCVRGGLSSVYAPSSLHRLTSTRRWSRHHYVHLSNNNVVHGVSSLRTGVLIRRVKQRFLWRRELNILKI